MVKEIYCKDVKFSEYSHWHRNDTHLGVQMVDIDSIETCIACSDPLILIETVKFVGQKEFKKGHTTTRKLAIKSNLPAFIVWYQTVGDTLVRVKAKKIAPDYKHGYTSKPIDYLPSQWLNYLEYKQVQHFPNCPKKELFIEKVSKDPKLRRSRIYASILSV